MTKASDQQQLNTIEIDLTQKFTEQKDPIHLTTVVGMGQINQLINKYGWQIEVKPLESPIARHAHYFLHTINFSESNLKEGETPLQRLALRHPEFKGRVLENLRMGNQDTMAQRFLTNLATIQNQLKSPAQDPISWLVPERGRQRNLSGFSGGPKTA